MRREGLTGLALTCVGVVVIAACSGFRSAPPVAPPNVVLILVDDLGYSDLGCYGNQFHRTPTFDRLAAEGVRFTDFYAAAPVCSASRASIQSGQSPARLGMTDFVPGHWRPFAALAVPDNAAHLPLELATTADLLQDASYATAYFGKWHLGTAPEHHPRARGYDEAIVTRGRHYAPDFRTVPAMDVPDGTFLGDFLTDRTLDFIERHRDRRFFVTLSHFAVHIPLEADPEVVRGFETGAGPAGSGLHPIYAAQLAQVDAALDRLLAHLERLGLADDTLVMVTSDNGGLHRIFTGVGETVTRNDPLRDEKGTLYEGGVRVPMIVRWPGQIPAGAVCETPAITTDLLPTLAELGGSAGTKPQVLDGISLTPVLRDPDALMASRDLFFHYPHYHHSRPAGAIRSGDWKLIEFFEDDRLELYDLRQDPGETSDLAARWPQRAEELHRRLAAWREDVGAALPTPNPDHDPGREQEWWSHRANRPLDREAVAQRYDSGWRPAPASDTARPPNVLLIIGDDQAWTDYGFMEHPVIRTPRLDRLAEQGLVYTRGYVPSSLCCPSLASLITGLTPHVHGITGNEPPRPGGTDHSDLVYLAQCEAMDDHIEQVATLPRLLGQAGYRSLQTGKWWHGGYQRGGFTHGMTHGDPEQSGRHGDEGLTIGREGLRPIRDFMSACVEDEVPFFLWYAPFLPHRPHDPPERLLARYRDRAGSEHVAKYQAMCEWFDETCGQLLDLLLEMQLAEDTLVVFLCDNGWIQREDAAGYAPRSKRSPYDGGLRTPIVLRWPGRVGAGRRDDVVMTTDLAPTILRACGRPVPATMQGVDLLDAPAVSARRTVYGEVFLHNAVDIHDPAANLAHRWCIDAGRHKLILPHAPNVPEGRPELFDLLTDPFEQDDLAAARPELVRELTDRLDAWWKVNG